MSDKFLDSQYPDIFEDCLSLLQSQRATLDECLQRYPDYADDLKQDLTLAMMTQHIKLPAMPTASLDALESHLLGRFDEQFNTPNFKPATNPAKTSTAPKVVRKQPSNITRMTAPFSRLAAAVMIIFFLSLGIGGGTVAASASSQPGDTLYGVKRAWEQIILLIASMMGELDDVWLHLAEVRYEELLLLYHEGTLTDAELDDFYLAAESAIIYVSQDTASSVILLTDTARPVFEESILKNSDELRRIQFLRILSPEIDVNTGQVNLPTEGLLPTLTPTIFVSFTPSPTITSTNTPTLTFTPSPTMTDPTATRTPTPSRTPTLIPSSTATTTAIPPSATPTQTWTPLPLPVLPTDATGEILTSDGQIIRKVTKTPEFVAPDASPYFVRETQESLKMTQTAIAQTPQP